MALLVCAFVFAADRNGVATIIVMIGIVTITNNFSFLSICFFVLRKVRYISFQRIRIHKLAEFLVIYGQKSKI
jgi:hypothetical protein